MKGIHSKNCVGFTLVELLIVLSIISVLVTVVAPGMQRFIDSVYVRQYVSELMTDIVFTRSEAIKRNRRIRMCPSPMAMSGKAECAGVFADGWVVFVDSDGDRVLGGDEDVLRISSGLDRKYSLTNRAGTRDAKEIITYWPDGSSRRNRTLMVCARGDPSVENWSVVMNLFGRPRMARGWGNCPVVNSG
ncbi:MAG: GspH/FimT family pseudopilin [Halioglobus sp.]